MPRPVGRPKRHLLTIAEMAAYLNVSRGTIYRLLDDGLPCIRVGSHTRFDQAEVLAWLKAKQAREG